MQFYVFGKRQSPRVVLIHGMQTPWQIWTAQIAHFCENYCVIVPALSGHEEETASEFISLEKEARQIEDYCLQDHGCELYAVCGLSMGGAIAYILWKNQKLRIRNLVMDGAPLVPYGELMRKIMTRQYLMLTRKSRKRDQRTLKNFKKAFLPEEYLDSFLKIADHMSDQSIKNIVSALSRSQMKSGIPSEETNIVYIHGTRANELLSKKSARRLRRLYPKSLIICFKGDAHCQKAIYAPEAWLQAVESVLVNQTVD